MITVLGVSISPDDVYEQWPLNSTEKMIVDQLSASDAVYEYRSLRELKFEILLRGKIVSSAMALSQSKASFATFAMSRCNPEYWERTEIGGFKLKAGVKPSDGINDIFANGRKYAFECATAIPIVYYKAVLETLGEPVFNVLFANLYLFSWHHDPDLPLVSFKGGDSIPGDVRYFKNPDVNPKTPEWQGENAVVLGDDIYFGHGIGIKNARDMISVLNRFRKPGATQSAYLTDDVTRPDFKKLAQYTESQLPETDRVNAEVTGHVKESISFQDYLHLQNTSKKRFITVRIGTKVFKQYID